MVMVLDRHYPPPVRLSESTHQTLTFPSVALPDQEPLRGLLD